jgi:opacity protein-like surface antigen
MSLHVLSQGTVALFAVAVCFATPASAADKDDGRGPPRKASSKDKDDDDGKDTKRREGPRKEKAAPKPKPKPKAAAPAKRENDDPPDTAWVAGLSGGVNIAGAGGDETENLDSTIGFDVGVKVLRYLAPFADLETGLYYTTKGYSRELQEIQEPHQLTLTVTDSFQYVQVPALIRLAMPKAKIKPFLNLGFYVAFLTGSEREDKAEWELETADGVLEPGSSSRVYEVPGAASFDAGFQVGAGVEWRFTDTFSFIAEAGYQRGLTDPVDETQKGTSTQSLLLPRRPAPDGTDYFDATRFSDDVKDAIGGNTAALENIARVHSVIQINAGIAMHF